LGSILLTSMSESAPILPRQANIEALEGQPSHADARRYLCAAGLSAIVPGTGQLFIGQRRKALVLLVLFSALLIGFWPLRLLRFYWGLVALFSAWIVLYLYACCSVHLAQCPPRRKGPSRWWLLATVPFVVLTMSLLGRLVTRASGFRSFRVPSKSMERTIQDGDQIVVALDGRAPERGQVIVFVRNKTYFVKRVAAISGDSIKGVDGAIWINGDKQVESYVEHTSAAAPFWINNFGPVSVPRGKCFVMGDNRDVSLDSRSPEFGFVDDSSIIGRPLYIFASNRVGRSIQ
jgi:signal peptidase I